MMNKGNDMERTYSDIMAMTTYELQLALVDIRVEHYMADPDMLRDLLRELFMRKSNLLGAMLKQNNSLDRSELIDELYNEGYFA
jgi:hypothetical protein